MNKFKSICTDVHTQNKKFLHNIYTDRQINCSSVKSSEQPIEDEKIFRYGDITFRFTGTGFRTPEQTVLFIFVPEQLLPGGYDVMCHKTAYEDYLLRLLADPVNALSDGLQNEHKDAREKAAFSMQTPGAVVQGRNGCIYVEEKKAFRLRISFRFPLINGTGINGKSGYKGVKLLLATICDLLAGLDRDAFIEHIRVYARQLAIRRFLKENHLLAFVADGSVLPRQGDTDTRMEGAVPFQTPPGLQVSIPMPEGGIMTGMGLKRGITIITGGGYSGKSTLLDALEQGIYFHAKGDGREYVIMDETACKIYAEDGRYIPPMDISPFFSYMPGNDRHNFRTLHASGSVSQAANIIEAVYGGSRCLLIDEDTSATNFMIRDEGMRRLVKKEPIVPYTDRIEELKAKGISTILVIGGSSEYLKYGDCILLLEDYHVYDKTEEVCQNSQNRQNSNRLSPVGGKDVSDGAYSWTEKKYLLNVAQGKEFYCSQCVQIENARYIKIDDYVADITRLTAVMTDGQINSLTWLLEKLLTEEGGEEIDLNVRCRRAVEELFSKSMDVVLSSHVHKYELCLEQVRSLDLLMAVCRMRNL